jgi:hypothetical protein
MVALGGAVEFPLSWKDELPGRLAFPRRPACKRWPARTAQRESGDAITDKLDGLDHQDNARDVGALPVLICILKVSHRYVLIGHKMHMDCTTWR